MAVQTTYGTAMTKAIEGALADMGDHDVGPSFNQEASAQIAFGRAVKFGTTDNGCLLPTAASSKIKGITLHTDTYSRDFLTASLGTTGVKVGYVMSLLRKGRVWAICQNGCVPGDRLFVRAVAGTFTVIGGLENAADSTNTVDCQKQGVWRSTAGAGGLAILEVDFTNAP